MVTESLSLGACSGKRDSAFRVLRKTGQGNEYSVFTVSHALSFCRLVLLLAWLIKPNQFAQLYLLPKLKFLAVYHIYSFGKADLIIASGLSVDAFHKYSVNRIDTDYSDL